MCLPHSGASAGLPDRDHVLNHISDAVITTDLNFRITSWNRAAEGLYGWPADAVMGTDILTVLLTDYADIERATVIQQLHASGVWRGEVLQRHRDGRTLSVAASVSLLRTPAGEPYGYLTVNRDITERKLAEAQLRSYATRLDMLFATARSFAEIEADHEVVMQRVADQMVNTLGDCCIVRIISQDQQQLQIAAFAYYDSARSEVQRLVEVMTAETAVMLDEPGTHQRVFRSGQALFVPVVDVEQLLAQANPRHRLWFEQFPPRSIIVVPLRHREESIGLLSLYRTQAHWAAFTEDDLHLTQRLADYATLAILNARLLQRVQLELAERQQAEQALETERALLARRVEEGTADLSAVNAELANAVRLKDDFLANMSHELRTPLNSILARTEALQEETYGPVTLKQHDVLQGITESGRHLLELITDILDLSKIEAGRLSLERQPVEVAALCHASLRIIAEIARVKRITIVSSFDVGVVSLVADERRLRQVLVNLLSNAVKFTPAGGKVGLDIHGDSASGAVTFSVWDTGIGIAKEDLTKLFHPFVQLDSQLGRGYEGTGLGLALVRRFVELHGGTVTVESTLGVGSRFSVTLPWDSEAQTSGHTALPAKRHVGVPAIRHVLIIEDAPTVADQMARYLEELGTRVTVSTHGSTGRSQAQELQPDVIILDLMLPDEDGWSVLRSLKADPRTAAIPIVVVSVVDAPAQAYAMGAAAVVLKPVDRARLVDALRRLPQPRAEEPAPGPLTGATPARPRLLLAEDHQMNIDVLSEYLDSKGYDVTVARNGHEALVFAQDARPDIILADIQMPGMDGLELIRRIRSESTLASIPIIALTALAMPGDRERCLLAGADDYLTKPVQLRALVTTIETHRQRRQSR